jgi:hypothetical protein
MTFSEGCRWLIKHPLHQATLDGVSQVRYNNHYAGYEILVDTGEWIPWVICASDRQCQIEPMIRAMPMLPAGDTWTQVGDVPAIVVNGGRIMAGCNNADELRYMYNDRMRLSALIAEYETRSAEAAAALKENIE